MVKRFAIAVLLVEFPRKSTQWNSSNDPPAMWRLFKRPDPVPFGRPLTLKEGRCSRRQSKEAPDKGLFIVEIAEPADLPDEDGLTVLTLDSDHGFFPTRIEVGLRGSPPGMVTVVTEMRACSNGCWFPNRSVQIYVPSKSDEKCRVREIVTTDLVIASELSRDDLTISMPEGTAIADQGTVGSQFVSEDAINIDPTRLEALYGMTKSTKDNYDKAMERQVSPDAEDVSGRRSLLWIWMNAAIVIGLLVVIWYSRRPARL